MSDGFDRECERGQQLTEALAEMAGNSADALNEYDLMRGEFVSMLDKHFAIFQRRDWTLLRNGQVKLEIHFDAETIRNYLGIAQPN